MNDQAAELNYKVNAIWLEEELTSINYFLKILNAREWRVTLAQYTQEALTKVTENNYDVVICDLILPNEGFENQGNYVDVDAGIKFVEKLRNPLRSGATHSDVPVIILSARGSTAEALSQFNSENGPIQVLTKPATKAEFLSVVTLVESHLKKNGTYRGT